MLSQASYSTRFHATFPINLVALSSNLIELTDSRFGLLLLIYSQAAQHQPGVCSMSNGQDDDAKKALDVARKKLAAGDLDGAIRFTKKSISLHDTVTAQSLLKELNALQKEGGPKANKQQGSAASSSSSFPSGSNGTANPRTTSSTSSTPPATEKRSYTPEQAALVKRVRSCKVTQYYEILSVEKGCEDVVIKKAYRKLALSLHPDKVCLKPMHAPLLQ